MEDRALRESNRTPGGELRFVDLVDLEELRALCESVTDLTGAVTAILDPTGTILVATGWRDLCTRFHRCHPVSAARCRESDTVLATRVREGEPYNVYRCGNGLVDVAVPIVVGGRHLATLFTGQFFFEPPDRDFFLRQAASLGFPREAYLEALERIPVFSEPQVRSLLDLLARLGRLMGRTGLVRKALLAANRKLREEIAERRRAEADLREANEGLEARVAERTEALAVSNLTLLARQENLREAEQRLRRTHFLAETALELTRSGYWRITYDGSGFYESSERAAAIYGDIPRPGLRVHILDEWYPCLVAADPEGAKRILQAYEDAVEGRSERFDESFPYRRRVDGRTVWVRSIGYAERDEQGRATHMYGVNQDITEQKLLELELQRAKEAAESANRAKSVFLANMSHEIRTPMNVILGFARLLQREADLSPRQGEYLEALNRAGEHLLELIDEVLEMSKIEAGRVVLRPRTFDLPGLLEETERLLRPRAEAKGLAFLLERDESLPRWVVADEGKLRQVLLNLLGNAVKFTRDGGVVLRGRVLDGGGDVRSLQVEVEDTGPGIGEEEMGHLFQRFEQAQAGRDAGGGAGLGLRISRDFLRIMGGDLEVHSRKGQGSLFRFQVPLQIGQPPGPSSSEEEPEAAPSPGGPSRILVVDDQEANRTLLLRLLEPLGAEIREARDGVEALEAWEAWRPDLILMDVRMPRMDGSEAIRRIRGTPLGGEVRLVAVTASAFEEDRQRLRADGADAFLRKPFRREELMGTIRGLFKAEEPERGNGTPPAPRRVSDEEIRGCLARLPREARESLREAVREGDYFLILTLLDRLDPLAPGLAEALGGVVRGMEFRRALDLLGGDGA